MNEDNNSSGQLRTKEGEKLWVSPVRIRETILNCKMDGKVTVDGMETTSWALHRIDQHLESIAKSLSIIAGAQAQIAMFESEEK